MSAICEWRIANDLCGKTKHCCTEILTASYTLTAKEILSIVKIMFDGKTVLNERMTGEIKRFIDSMELSEHERMEAAKIAYACYNDLPPWE
ncbi:MAG: hypothetical protein FWB91_13120 [Defluviitaleaceae bacterium]|nr:hypothetical protein [Defluviitaleaceae bacterium]